MDRIRVDSFVRRRLIVGLLVLALWGCGESRRPIASNPPLQAVSNGHAFEIPVSGVITVDRRLLKKVSKTDVLYIIAYSSDRPKGFGPPLAAKRVTDLKFPLSYQIGPEDLLQEGTRFSGGILLSARIDKDGDAGPVQPGDMEGSYAKNPATPGQRGVDILIDKVD